MLSPELNQLIDTFEKQPGKVRQAIAGLSPQQLTAFPVPGTWSIQQIVVHLSQSEAIGCERILRITSENNPLLMDWDENAALQTFDYHAVPIEPSLTLLETMRSLTAGILRRQPIAAFDRTGVHSARGKLVMKDVVAMYVKHVDHHLGFIEKKRAMV